MYSPVYAQRRCQLNRLDHLRENAFYFFFFLVQTLAMTYELRLLVAHILSLRINREHDNQRAKLSVVVELYVIQVEW